MSLATAHQRLLANPMSLDSKRANCYVAGNSFVIETIPQFLTRVIQDIRDGHIITMYLPKDGYTPLGAYPMTDIDNALSNYDTYLYAFIEGISDEDFTQLMKLGDEYLKLDQTTPQAIINGSPIVEGIQFDTTPSTINVSEGLLRWNPTDGTLDLGMMGGVATQQVGQELPLPAYNNTGVLIPEGTPVYISGRQGHLPEIAPARSDNASTSTIFGITTTTFDTTGTLRQGLVTVFGYVRKLKTNYTGDGIWGTTWAANDRLYVSKTTAGQLTNIEPSAPHHSDVVATVAIVGAVGIGSIHVLNQKHYTLEELTDVNGTLLTASGQFPVWNETNGYFDFTENINDYKHINYCPTNLTVNTGTLLQGTVSDLCALDGTDVIVQENNGADPLRVTLSFSDVERLTSFSFYGRYQGGAGHIVYIEAYNYNLSTWQLLGELGTNTTDQWYSYNIFLPTNFVSAGVVQVRFNHQGNGINGHQLILDYVDVNYGGGGGSSFQTASEIAFVPMAPIGSSNVQDAISEAYADAATYADGKVVDAINDGVTTTAPSQNAVFDGLAGKQNTLTNPVTGNATPFATNALIKATGTGNQVAASGVTVDGSNNVVTAGTIQGTTAKLTNLTDGYIPYHISDASGLGNSLIYTNNINSSFGTAALNNRILSEVNSSGSLTIPLAIRNNSSINGTAVGMDFFAINSFVSTGQISNKRIGSGDYSMYLGAYNSFQTLTLRTSGNVGIGTTTPQTKLDVNGTFQATTATLTNLTGTGTRLATVSSTGAVGALSDGASGQFLKTDGAGVYSFGNSPEISSGSSAPASTPNKIGDLYIDTVNFKLYFSKGTSSSSDWIIVN